MYPILLGYSIKKALKQSANQVRLSDAKGHEKLNNIMSEIHNRSKGKQRETVVNRREIQLELKKGKLVSVSCNADLTSTFSIRQERDTYILILRDGEEDVYKGEADNSLKIRIAVVA